MLLYQQHKIVEEVIMNFLDTPFPYLYGTTFNVKRVCKKNYKNKDANIEYYYDEKGQIKKRKVNNYGLKF